MNGLTLFRGAGLRRALSLLLAAALLLCGIAAFAPIARAEEAPAEALDAQSDVDATARKGDPDAQADSPVPQAGHEKQTERENTYAVTFPVSDKYTITAQGDASAVPHGGSLTFTLTPADIYSGVTPVIKDGSKTLKGRQSDGGYTYTLKNVRSDKCISVNDADWKADGFAVTFPSGRGYTVTDIVGGGKLADNTYSVPKLGTLRFKVKVDRGYDRKNLVVTANGDELYERNGEYILSEVASNIEIRITFKKAADYTVTLPSGEGYAIKDVRGGEWRGAHTYTVRPGADMSFRVEARKDGAGLIVRANGVAIKPIRGRYTLKDIREDIHVSVSFAKEEALTVTLVPGKGYRYTDVAGGVRAGDDAYLVPYGKALSFRLELDKGYVSPLVKAGGAVLAADKNGVYTLDNVRGDTNVTVSLETAYEAFSVYHKATDITVSGYATKKPKLHADMLSSTGAEYQKLVAQSDEGDVLGAYSLRLSGADFQGKLNISFPVGDGFNGEYVNILRLRSNGEAQVFTAKVRNGYAVISTGYTGAFLIAGPVDATLLPPKTGDAPVTAAPVALIGAAIALLFCAAHRRKQYGPGL